MAVVEMGWHKGRRLLVDGGVLFSGPISMRVRLDDDTLLLPEYAEHPIPFVSTRLFDVLLDAGVDNVDGYELEFQVEEAARSVQGYVAINVVGLVSAVDMEASSYHADAYSATWGPVGENEPVFFDDMVIDETRTHDLLLFRVSQNPTVLFVHESVKARVEEAGIDTVTFLLPEEVAG